MIRFPDIAVAKSTTTSIRDTFPQPWVNEAAFEPVGVGLRGSSGQSIEVGDIGADVAYLDRVQRRLEQEKFGPVEVLVTFVSG